MGHRLEVPARPLGIDPALANRVCHTVDGQHIGGYTIVYGMGHLYA